MANKPFTPITRQDQLALSNAAAWLNGIGEPTEHEPFYFQFEGPFHDGWAATLVWAHHDGDIELGTGRGPTLREAIEVCITDYRGGKKKEL